MDIGFGEPDSADGALSVSVGCGVIDAFFAEDVGAGLEDHFSFPLGPAATHDL